MKFTAYGTLIFAVILFSMSAMALVYEVRPFSPQYASPTIRFSTLESDNIAPSLSIYSNRLLLNNCLEAIAGPTGMAQPSQRRMAMLKNCQYFAQKSYQSNLTFALAWYIAAYASVELKQYDTFNFQLAAAQKTAPNEQWLTEFRVSLAENNLSRLGPETIKGNERDLKLLVQSKIGVASIARRYVDQTDFRKRISDIVETLSEARQENFINYVRAAATQRAASR